MLDLVPLQTASAVPYTVKVLAAEGDERDLLLVFAELALARRPVYLELTATGVRKAPFEHLLLLLQRAPQLRGLRLQWGLDERDAARLRAAAGDRVVELVAD